MKFIHFLTKLERFVAHDIFANEDR